MLGHELRNPLAPIAAALKVLNARGVTSREQEIIERQVEHLNRLVDDLLDVARVTRGQLELRRKRVQIADIAQRAVEMTAPLLEEKSHTLQVDIAGAGLAVDADPARLAQVLANLLTNAAKYSDPGGLSPRHRFARDGRTRSRAEAATNP